MPEMVPEVKIVQTTLRPGPETTLETQADFPIIPPWNPRPTVRRSLNWRTT
jgi:hypothetical protein